MLDAVSIDHCRMLIQTLGHSLWQAGIVAVLCWLTLRSLPAKRTTTRYAVASGGLLVVVLATLMTAATVSTDVTTSTDTDAATTRGSEISTIESSPLQTEQAPVESARQSSPHADQDQTKVAPSGHSVTSHTAEEVATDFEADRRRPASTTSEVTKQSQLAWPALAAGLWVFGVLGMMLRLVRTIVALRKLEPSQTPTDETMLSQVRGVIQELSHRMNLRWPVSLVVSDKVSVPGIVGTFWPTLLMPPAMLTGVPIEQLRIVIAHELAHAKRFDFLVNLGQLLVESFLFFNPAVWWLSRQIRIEREACCDAAAVTATGSAVPVARTLLDIVDRLTESLGTGAAGEFALAAGVQSFGGDESPESRTPLFDRVRRIVTPDQRPHVRVPWYTLLGVVAAYTFVSFGLYEGADATVQIVQQALSPKERVEKIEKLIASQGELAHSEGVHVYKRGAHDLHVTAPRKEVRISGTLRMHDGTPVPSDVSIIGMLAIKFANGNGQNGNAFQSTVETSVIEHRFEETVSCLTNKQDGSSALLVYVGLRKDDSVKFAPAVAGPFQLTADGPPENIELVIKPGFDTHLEIVDEQSKPISDAFVSSSYFFGVNGNGTSLQSSRSASNKLGTVAMPNATSDLPLRAHIRAPGYEKERFELTLSSDEKNRIVLKKATPTKLLITSPVSGEPVTLASAYIAEETRTRNGHSTSWGIPSPRDHWGSAGYEEREAPLYRFGYSETDAAVVLDSLASDTNYDVLILADGFAPQIVREVRAGQQPIDVTLKPALSVKGQIIGDLATLRQDRKTKQRYIQYSNLTRNTIVDTQIEERDGVGHFHISNLGEGELLLRLPGRRMYRNLKDSIDDWVIKLDEPSRFDNPPRATVGTAKPKLQGQTRKVILTLVGADPKLPIKGQLRAGFVPREKPGAYSSENFDIENSRVEFDVEVPTKIIWSGKGFTGYSVVKKSEVEVGVSEEPFRADVQLLPAGAVRGEVRMADGSLSRSFQTYVLPVERIDGFNNKEVRIDGGDVPGEFLLAGLPLGHEYQALVLDERSGSVASVLTEPFRLDEGNPIADLKFQFDEGREHTIRLVDEKGNPASGARAGGWFYPTNRFSRSGGFRANENGEIVVKQISESIPGRMELHIKHAAGFVGHIAKLDWNNLPETMTLSKGVSASGRLVDLETGRGIAKARFHLYPHPSKAATSKQAITASTDEQGNFSFDSLERINYQLHVYGAVAPRVPLVKNSQGNLTPDYSEIDSSSFPAWFVEGGRAEPYVIKVKVLPKRGLKLAAPR